MGFKDHKRNRANKRWVFLELLSKNKNGLSWDEPIREHFRYYSNVKQKSIFLTNITINLDSYL